MYYAKSSVGFRSRSRRLRARRRRAFAIVTLLVALALTWLVVQLRSASAPLASDVVSSARSARFSGKQALQNGSCVAGKSRSPAAENRCSTALSASLTWSSDDRRRLWDDLHGAFAPAIAGATGWSFATVTLDGDTIFDERAARAVAPASVQKLIVAATALDALGPAYRYHTLFAGSDGVADDGTLQGNLWLIGSGDPSLESSDLRNGVAVLARSGLRHIAGRIVVDDTAIGGPELNPHWASDDSGQDYAPPTSAISLDGDTIASVQDVGGVEETVWTPMQNVARYVAARTSAMFASRGIASAAMPSRGSAPLESVILWDHRSAPLRALESHMLFVSDNHYAEQLLRTVGEAAAGAPDDAGGIGAERAFLARNGVPTPGLRLLDGSGLSEGNRVAALTFARVLAREEPSLYRLLPLGGRQGTLEDYDFTTALGRVRAKSGHLSDVSALAGYVTTMHHGRVAFAFLIDGSPGNPDDAIVRAVDRLAEF